MKTDAGAIGTLVAVLISIVFNGCAGVGNAQLTASEKMMWSTYAIGTPKGMATCIVVNKRDSSAPRGVVPVLITAKHVLAAAPHGPYFLAVRTVDQNGNSHVAILEFEPPRSGGTIYTQHPQHDVAALELRLPKEMSDAIDVPSFLDEDAIGQNGDQPRPGQEISVLGFPKVFPGTAVDLQYCVAARLHRTRRAIDGTPKNFSLTLLHTLAIAAHQYLRKPAGAGNRACLVS